MGHWGPGPFQNDTAADWIDDEYNDKLLKGALENGSFEVLRAAAQIIIKLGYHFAFDCLIVDEIFAKLSTFDTNKIKLVSYRAFHMST